MDNITADFVIEQYTPFDIEMELLSSTEFDCSFDINVIKAYWGSIEGDIVDQTDLMELFNSKVDTSQYNEDIAEINGRIDNTINNIDGSALIDVQRDNQTVTISSKTYTYEQGIASDTWVITHNLNKKPSIVVVDSSGEEQVPNERIYNDENTVTLRFLAEFKGKAFLN